MSSNNTKNRINEKTIQRLKYLKPTVIKSYQKLTDTSQPETYFNIACDLNQILKKNNIKPYAINTEKQNCRGLSNLMDTYLEKYKRTFKVKKNPNSKNAYLFFAEDILYLLVNQSSLYTPKNILGFIAPKVHTLTLSDELSKKKINIIFLSCKRRNFRKELIKFYRESQTKPDFIIQGDTNIALCFINKESFDYTYQEAMEYSKYDKKHFQSLLEYNANYIDFIMNNYLMIHPTKK